jgi:phosphate transport system substrate-binding protein
MYLGEIKSWNDPQIAKLNPGIELPSTAVAPVYRSDASGDTYAFTDFLSHASSAWRSKVGSAATAVSWPTGVGAAKNSGVAAAVQSTPGAIAYVAIGEATADKLHYATVENRSQAFVKPSTASIASAAQTAGFRSNNSASIVDPPSSAKGAYPISTFTYAIVPRSSHKLAALRRFLTYAVTAGQKYATALEFAPLPQDVVAKDRAIIKGL